MDILLLAKYLVILSRVHNNRYYTLASSIGRRQVQAPLLQIILDKISIIVKHTFNTSVGLAIAAAMAPDEKPDTIFM